LKKLSGTLKKEFLSWKLTTTTGEIDLESILKNLFKSMKNKRVEQKMTADSYLLFKKDSSDFILKHEESGYTLLEGKKIIYNVRAYINLILSRGLSSKIEVTTQKKEMVLIRIL